MRYLPLGIDVQGRSCVVVGGGAVGTRKALTLLRFGAEVTVVSPVVTDELRGAAGAGRLRCRAERFEAVHVADAFLVVMATDDEALNAAGTRLAAESGALACDASSGRGSPVIFGALLEKDELTIATFSDGRSPGRSRALRDEIARQLSERDIGTVSD